MQLTLNIPDAVASRVVDAFATYYQYAANQQAGETKAQFAKRMLIKHIREVVMYSVEGQPVVTAAEQQQKAAINSTIDIT